MLSRIRVKRLREKGRAEGGGAMLNRESTKCWLSASGVAERDDRTQILPVDDGDGSATALCTVIAFVEKSMFSR